jgi:hypothetical protein
MSRRREHGIDARPPGAWGLATRVNGRKLSLRFGLLRNSTIFRCAKNWDSDSARRLPPKRRESLSSGPIVHTGGQTPRSLLLCELQSSGNQLGELASVMEFLDSRVHEYKS